MTDFYSEFEGSINAGDLTSANNALMKELGRILIKKREDFVHLLNESGLPATADMTDVRLIDLYIKNISNNPKLMLGSSLLINVQNAKMGFDGQEEISDLGVKNGYAVMRNYFDNTGETAEDFANAGGLWAGAIQGVAGSTTQIAKGIQEKRKGVLGQAEKQAEARNAMVQSILEQRKAQQEIKSKELETSAKTTKTVLIVSAVIIGLAIIGGVIYVIKKK